MFANIYSTFIYKYFLQCLQILSLNEIYLQMFCFSSVKVHHARATSYTVTRLQAGTHYYCTVLTCTVLTCTVLYCTDLYCTILYCTVLTCEVRGEGPVRPHLL